MAKKKHPCQPCHFRGRKTKATTGYVSAFSGEKTHCCVKCLEEYEEFKAHMLPVVREVAA